MSESDEWTSEIKSAIAALVRKAVLKERDALAGMIESVMQKSNHDSGDFIELLNRVAARKLQFQGERI